MPEVLVTGYDFVAAPRLSPDGRVLAHLRWNHPAMPWDATELVLLDLASGTPTVVAGGPGESVAEPVWTPDGALWFLSDRDGWWNLYRWSAAAGVESMVRIEAEIGVPGWALGSARYVVLEDGRVVFARQRAGYDWRCATRTAPCRSSTCRSPGTPQSVPPARTGWWW
jgi:hypothetical protein